MKIIRYVIISASILISGCSFLSPIQTQPPKAYLINTIPNSTVKNHPQKVTLLIMQPDTRPIYNTTQMAYTTHPYQVNYFGENQWAETPSQMLLPLMVQTLQNTHYYRAVVSPPYVGRYNYLVSTQILKLQQNFMGNTSKFELSIRAQITSVATNQVIAIKQFNITISMPTRTPYSGVVSANRAVAQFLKELTAFCIAKT